MRTGIKLGPRAAAFVAVLIAASAVGILTPTLSNTVSKDVQVTGFAVTLTVDGIPDSVAPGGVFRVIATLANNANRPVPGVLRMEVRNPNNTVPDELTVYSQCGAEEVVSGTGLTYFIGWHWPVFSERFVAFGGPSQDGFLVEVNPQSRGSFQFKLWAERPDALGIPHHPYTCGPL